MPTPKRGPQRPLTPGDLRDALSETSRDIIGHLNQSQGAQNERLGRIENRLGGVEGRLERMETSVEAIKRMLAMRQELQNLVRVLKRNGIKVDEAEVFVQ